MLPNSLGIHTKSSIDANPVILFIHFSGGNLRMWDGIIPQFEKEYSILAADLRGHGKSDKPLRGYHIDDMANDLYLLLKELNVEKCHVVGSSLGAEVGVSLAAAHPEMVLSLVCEGALYNEFGEFGLFNGLVEEFENKKETWRTELVQREDPVYSSIAEFMEQQKVAFEEDGLWNPHFAAFFEGSVEEKDDGTIGHYYSNHVRTEYMKSYWDLRFEDYYRKVRCPVLFLPSEEERRNERICHSLQAFAGMVEKSEVHLIEGSLHAYVWMQFAEAAGGAVKSFIRKYE